MKIKAVGAYSAKQPLEPMDITRREPGPNDVKIEIAYCGVCHSDLHQVRSEWAGTVYPCVPGHEIVGRVVAVGDQVSCKVLGYGRAGGDLNGQLLLAGVHLVHIQRLADDIADGHARIQRAVGILEYHLKFAPHPTECFTFDRCQINTVENNFAPGGIFQFY